MSNGGFDCACGSPISVRLSSLRSYVLPRHGAMEHLPANLASFVMRSELRDVAYHESGHAVVARRVGWPVILVSASWSRGVASYGARDFQGSLQQSERELALVSLGGLAAQQASVGKELRLSDAELRYHVGLARNHRAGDCDLCMLCRALRVSRSFHDDAEFIGLIQRYTREANELVRRLDIAADITRVAEALIQRGALSGHRVNELIGAGAASRSAKLTRFVEPQYQIRGAQVRSETFDQKAHTISIVWSTGARIRRNTWLDGPVDEELEMGANNVRLGRLNSSAPLLNSHAAGTLASIIGAVVPGSAKIERGRGVAIDRLSKREDVAGIVQMCGMALSAT